MVYVVLSIVVKGNERWIPKERPAVFGTDIHLVCNIPNNNQNNIRQWIVGNNYRVIIVNGLSLNKTKYREELNEIEHVSTLTIMSLEENDVNTVYVCVHGFWEYRATLKLEEGIFEFHPSNLLPVKPFMDGQNISLTVTFTKVYPIPVCSAVIGVKDISSYLDVTNKPNIMLYKSVITLRYNSHEEECNNLLRVNCRVGQTDLRVVDSHIMCSNVQVEEKSSQPQGIIILAVLLPVIVALLISVIWIIRKPTCRHKILSHLCNENPPTNHATSGQEMYNGEQEESIPMQHDDT